MQEFIISASVDQHLIKLATGVLEPLPGQRPAFTHTQGGLKASSHFDLWEETAQRQRDYINTQNQNLLVVTAHGTTELPRTNYRWVKMHLSEIESVPATDLLWQETMAPPAETSE